MNTSIVNLRIRATIPAYSGCDLLGKSPGFMAPCSLLLCRQSAESYPTLFNRECLACFLWNTRQTGPYAKNPASFGNFASSLSYHL